MSTATDFRDPRIIGSGSFSGADFESRPANYTVGVRGAWGTPRTPAHQGQVVACLPEGTHDFRPFVISVNPGGGTSTTELPAVLGIDGVPVSVGEIFATIGGGPAIPVCTACDEDPAFTVDVPLAECDNDSESDSDSY